MLPAYEARVRNTKPGLRRIFTVYMPVYGTVYTCIRDNYTPGPYIAIYNRYRVPSAYDPHTWKHIRHNSHMGDLAVVCSREWNRKLSFSHVLTYNRKLGLRWNLFKGENWSVLQVFSDKVPPPKTCHSPSFLRKNETLWEFLKSFALYRKSRRRTHLRTTNVKRAKFGDTLIYMKRFHRNPSFRLEVIAGKHGRTKGFDFTSWGAVCG